MLFIREPPTVKRLLSVKFAAVDVYCARKGDYGQGGITVLMQT